MAPFSDGEIQRLTSDRRFQTVVDFLDRINQRGSRPPHNATFLGFLQHLRSLGKDPSDPSTASQLAQIAVDGLGRTWLQSVIGDSARDDAALARRIHQALWRRSRAVAEHVALIVSLIFDTADEALAAIDSVVSNAEDSVEEGLTTEEELCVAF